MPSNIHPEWELAEKRFRKALRRKKKKIELARAEAVSRQKFKQHGLQSPVITQVARSYTGKPATTRRRIHLNLPQSFSIIENPKGVLQSIGFFAKSIRAQRLYEVAFDHGSIVQHDLAAESLLDLIADELRSETRFFRKRTRFYGYYPSDPVVKRFIRSMGIIKHLEVSHEYPPEDETKKIRLFDYRNRDYPWQKRPERADTKARTMARFVDHVNDCLKDNGRKLTSLSVQKLGEYVGEILDNAEEHSGMFEWTLAGYLDNSLAEPICEIAILNLGKTIAETLQELSEDSYTKMQIAPYIDKHSANNLFGSNWRVEDLLALVALQGHVSRKNESPSDTRGQGTVELIQFFQKVYSECMHGQAGAAAKMAILSGGTHILFDGAYTMSSDAGGRNRIAFNSENDLDKKPDSKYVKSLGDYYFPGTIISIRFPLQPSSTQDLPQQQ